MVRMGIIDTSLVIDRAAEGKLIDENVCIITVIEYPMLLEYGRFHGKVLSPESSELQLALELQKKLAKIGRMKSAADLIIAATCINYNEILLTNDSDFYDIAEVSDLKIK